MIGGGTRRTLGRLHTWIGWAVALPMLLWTVTGLWMVARPIEEVRGETLVAEAPPLAIPSIVVPPQVGARALARADIGRRAGRSIWALSFADGGSATASLATGVLLPAPTRAEAVAAARAHLLRPGDVSRVTRTSADAPPIDLRRPRPAWRVEFADGARVYVDADTSAVLALRTRQWRLFDFMWGLHILAPHEREDTSHPLLIAAAAFGLLTVVAGVALLPRSRRKKR